MKKSIIVIILITLSLTVNAQTDSRSRSKKHYDFNFSTDIRSNNVPNLIPFQGRLTDDSGNAVNEIVNITFSLYDVETGGSSLWSETQSVNITEGLFNVTLGNITPMNEDDFNSANRWIAIAVGTDSEMSPRTRITAVPYALQSGTSTPDADWTISGDDIYHETGKVGIGTTTPDEKLSVVGTVRASKDTDETEYVEIVHGGSNAVLNWNGDGDLNFRYGNSTLATLKQSGDFNIPATQGYQIGGDTVLHKNGGFSIFVGKNSGQNITTGQANTFVGQYSGNANTEGEYNTFLGIRSGEYNTIGDYNCFVGGEAGQRNTDGSNNVFLGVLSGEQNTDGSDNVFLGYTSGENHTTGSNNTFLGNRAGRNNLTGSDNVFIGKGAGANETDSDKLYIANSNTSNPLIWGDFATGELEINGSVTATSYTGDGSGLTNLSPDSDWTVNGDDVYHETGNVGIGTTTPGQKLTVIGPVRSANETEETNYVEVDHGGSNAYLNWEGNGNLEFRYQNNTLAYLKQNGDFNIPFTQGYQIGGETVLHKNGGYSIFVGRDSGQNITTGEGNIFVGQNSGNANTEGNNNTLLGTASGNNNTIGSNNTYLGHRAGRYNESGSGNVFLGKSAGANETGSDKLYIENSDNANPLIYGDFATNELRINGTLEANGVSINGTIASNQTSYQWFSGLSLVLNYSYISNSQIDFLSRGLGTTRIYRTSGTGSCWVSLPLTGIAQSYYGQQVKISKVTIYYKVTSGECIDLTYVYMGATIIGSSSQEYTSEELTSYDITFTTPIDITDMLSLDIRSNHSVEGAAHSVTIDRVKVELSY
ncbi:MAG: hypothetical protein K8S23_12415 [Candidatus Cloacimonetes bacterium]|nr:hypothetical protein [Candidatus Cloacimonadota bacterium]